MKRHRLVKSILSLVLALVMIGAAGAVAASAAPEDGEDEWYDYVYGYNEGENNYVNPENLEDLPQADESQVVDATAVAIPNVEVSDATLFSGIVMWLCVALGIAVIVGVLVSKRTRRRR